MSLRTSVVTYVGLCDAEGRLIWSTNPDPAYKPGLFAWDYASPDSRELVKNSVSRAVALRESSHIQISTRKGELYELWYWPLNSPELAVCVLAIRVPSELARLSAREKECLQLLAQGESTREIARAIDVSVSTVHTHFRRARQKLKLRSVEALIGFAARYCYPSTAPLKSPAIAPPVLGKGAKRAGLEIHC